MNCYRNTQRSVEPRNGFTLTELVVVLTILVLLGGLAAPRLLSTVDAARETTVRSSVVEVRDAIKRFWSDCKYQYETTAVIDQRIQLGQLFVIPISFSNFDPNVGLGWNGPYLESDGSRYLIDAGAGFTEVFGDASQLSFRDTFINQDLDQDGSPESGSPFVIQEPTLVNLQTASLRYSLGDPREVRVVSAGPDGILDIDEARFASELESNPSLQGDDIYVSFTLR